MTRLYQNQRQSVKSLAFAKIFHITIARYARNGRNVKIVQTVKNSIDFVTHRYTSLHTELQVGHP